MGDLARFGEGGAAVVSRGPTFSAIAALLGAVFSFLAVTVGACLFVVFAATLAVVLLLAALLVGLAALVMHSGRPGTKVVRGAHGVLSLGRPPAHAWIAYQWDRPRA